MEISKINFNDTEIPIIDDGLGNYILLKPLVESLELNWNKEKNKAKETSKVVMFEYTHSTGITNEMLAVDSKNLFLYLESIQARKDFSKDILSNINIVSDILRNHLGLEKNDKSDDKPKSDDESSENPVKNKNKKFNKNLVPKCIEKNKENGFDTEFKFYTFKDSEIQIITEDNIDYISVKSIVRILDLEESTESSWINSFFNVKYKHSRFFACTSGIMPVISNFWTHDIAKIYLQECNKRKYRKYHVDNLDENINLLTEFLDSLNLKSLKQEEKIETNPNASKHKEETETVSKDTEQEERTKTEPIEKSENKNIEKLITSIEILNSNLEKIIKHIETKNKELNSWQKIKKILRLG